MHFPHPHFPEGETGAQIGKVTWRPRSPSYKEVVPRIRDRLAWSVDHCCSLLGTLQLRLFLHHTQTCPKSPHSSGLWCLGHTTETGQVPYGESVPTAQAPSLLPAPPGLPDGSQAPAEGSSKKTLDGSPAVGSRYQGMSQPSPRRPRSGCIPTSPGGEHLGPGREQLPVLVAAASEAAHPSTVYKAFPGPCIISQGLYPLGRAPQAPNGHRKGPGSEVVSSLPDVTLPSAFWDFLDFPGPSWGSQQLRADAFPALA